MAKLSKGEDGNTISPNNFTPWHIPKALVLMMFRLVTLKEH